MVKASLDYIENKWPRPNLQGPGHLFVDSATMWAELGRTPYCGKRTLWTESDGRVRARPALCGMWSCAVCGPQRYAWFLAEMSKNIETQDMVRFATLTLRARGLATPGARVHLMESWARLRKSLTRSFGLSQYIWVVETTKRGWPHMHVFLDVYVPQAALSSMWSRATGDSRIVWITRLHTLDCARYVAKYCVKEARDRRSSGSSVPDYGHTYGKSRGIVFQPYRSTGGGGWQVSAVPWSYARQLVESVTGLDTSGGTERQGMEWTWNEGQWSWSRAALKYFERKMKGGGE